MSAHDPAAVEGALGVLGTRLRHVMPYTRPHERAAVLDAARAWFATPPPRDGLADRLAAVVGFAEDFGRDQDRLVVVVPDTELVAVHFDVAAARDPRRPVARVRLAGGTIRHKPWPCPADTPLRRLVEDLHGEAPVVRVPRCVNRGEFAWADDPVERDRTGAASGMGAHHALGHLLALDRALAAVGVGVRDVVTAGPLLHVVDCGPRGEDPWRVDGAAWRPDPGHPRWPDVARGHREGMALLRRLAAAGGLDPALRRFPGAAAVEFTVPDGDGWL